MRLHARRAWQLYHLQFVILISLGTLGKTLLKLKLVTFFEIKARLLWSCFRFLGWITRRPILITFVAFLFVLRYFDPVHDSGHSGTILGLLLSSTGILLGAMALFEDMVRKEEEDNDPNA